MKNKTGRKVLSGKELAGVHGGSCEEFFRKLRELFRHRRAAR